LQTLQTLLHLIQKEKGCISYRYYQDMENENAFILASEWVREEDLDNHLRSKHFKVLEGVVNLLSEPPKIQFNAVVNTGDMDSIKAQRGLNVKYSKEEKMGIRPPS